VRAGQVESRRFTRADGLAQDSVYAVHEARDGSVWAASLSGGVSRLRDGRFTTYTSYSTAGGLASDTVAAIVDDGEGTTWFATPSGLSALSNAGWRTYTTRAGLPSDEVNCLLVGSSGALWIGTGDGLALRAEGRIRAARVASLSPSEQVFGMAEDAGGWLWLATSRRVLRVKEAPLRLGAEAGAELTEFGQADGLRGVEGVKRHRSMVSDRQGRIWLSTDAGLSVIDPSRLRGNDPVTAHVVAVAADGTSPGPGGSPGAGRPRSRHRFDRVSCRFRSACDPLPADGFDLTG
jgi:ligand-binding sensor domain-containing protein